MSEDINGSGPAAAEPTEGVEAPAVAAPAVKKFGIQSIKDLLTPILRVINAVGKALEDGKVTWQDTVYLTAVVPALPGAVNALFHFQEIKAEIVDFDHAEVEEFNAWFVSILDIPEKEVEKYIEMFVNHLDEIYDIVMSLTASFKTKKTV